MHNRIRDALRGRPLRLMACFALAAAFVTGTITAPAHADIRPNGMGNDAPRAPARQQVADREHGRGHHHYEKRGGRDYYYTAPTVVYAPQGYYQQPGETLYFSFPLPR